LQLHPQIRPQSGALRFSLGGVAGSERKTSGSYYTPEDLVRLLILSALLPVIRERVGRATTIEDKAQALLAIRVLDPACGSGHFLLAAAGPAAGVARPCSLSPEPCRLIRLPPRKGRPPPPPAASPCRCWRIGAVGAVLVGVSRVDASLERLLLAVLLPSPSGRDALFQPDRPLGSFGAKISLVHRLGLIDRPVERSLHTLRRVRNAFAHSTESAALADPAHAGALAEAYREAQVIPLWSGCPCSRFSRTPVMPVINPSIPPCGTTSC